MWFKGDACTMSLATQLSNERLLATFSCNFNTLTRFNTFQHSKIVQTSSMLKHVALCVIKMWILFGTLFRVSQRFFRGLRSVSVAVIFKLSCIAFSWWPYRSFFKRLTNFTRILQVYGADIAAFRLNGFPQVLWLNTWSCDDTEKPSAWGALCEGNPRGSRRCLPSQNTN